MLKVIKHAQTSDPLRSKANGASGVDMKTPLKQIDSRSLIQKAVQSKSSDIIRNDNSADKKATREGGLFGNGFPLSPIAKGIGLATSGFTTMNDTTSETSLAIRDSLSNAAINSGNPIAMAIGAAAKVVDAIGDATGFHIDDLDKDAAKDAGVSGGARFLNNAMNAIPGNSLLMAAFSPGKTKEAKGLDMFGEDVESGYSGTARDIDSAEKLSGKRTLFGIGRNKINRYINDTNRKTETINQLGYTNTLRKSSDYATNLSQQNLNRYAGTNYMMNVVGKNGMKMLSVDEIKEILAKRATVEKFQNGGVVGIDTNILPEGSLHARKNHLSEINPDLEDATKKGIPVMTAEEGGELSQIAEIEHSEIILRLEVTKKLEELRKDGSEEAMIEAGKLIAEELIENTQDNVGMITEEVEDDK